MIWRGPMLTADTQSCARGMGRADYLIIDLRRAPAMLQLTLIQTVAVTAAVLVTTPSTVRLPMYARPSKCSAR